MWSPVLKTAALLSLAGVTAADWLVLTEICFVTACSYQGTWHTDFGWYLVDVTAGCRSGAGVPGLTEVCLDLPRNRGHFKFSHQNNKRCLVATDWQKGDCGFNACSDWYFYERPCTWREVPELEDGSDANSTELDTVSALPERAALPEQTAQAVRFKA